VMRMADADLLPFDPSGSAETVKRYVGELKTELKEKQDKANERNREIEEGVFTATADPQKRYVPPSKESVPPYLNFAPLENGVDAYSMAAKRYKAAFAKLTDANPTVWDSPELKIINQQLIQTERTFMTTEGLKERPWFKHQIYAPGAYTGYGVKTIPAVREMMEEDKWADADAGSVIAGGVLLKQAALVDSIAAELEKVVGQNPPATKTAKRQVRADTTSTRGK
jgi:N-acetylated-alpha-linked acidic dipeptidase